MSNTKCFQYQIIILLILYWGTVTELCALNQKLDFVNEEVVIKRIFIPIFREKSTHLSAVVKAKYTANKNIMV